MMSNPHTMALSLSSTAIAQESEAEAEAARFRLEWANSVLHGFDIQESSDNDESRAFLASVIASSPRDAAVAELYGLALMRGAEEWDMLMACASSLRDRVHTVLIRAGADGTLDAGLGLLCYVHAVLSGEAGKLVAALDELERGSVAVSRTAAQRQRQRQRQRANVSKKRRPVRAAEVSHFWAGPEEQETSSRSRILGSGGTVVPNIGGGGLFPKLEEMGREGTNIKSEECANSMQARGVIHREDDNKLESRLLMEEEVCVPLPHVAPKPKPSKKNVVKSPFFSPLITPIKNENENENGQNETETEKKKKKKPTRPLRPVPPLPAPRFGLIQEELTHDPFALLIAVTFLIKTTGRAAIPVFRRLMALYPTPEALAAADPAHIVPMIRHLGLGAVRCAAVQRYARAWVRRPPCRGARFPVKNYPRRGDGLYLGAVEFGPEEQDVKDREDDGQVKEEEELEEGNAVEDSRRRALGHAWEVGHLTQGRYAIDSWRIFCRDIMLGRSDDWTGTGKTAECGELLGFQPEWMRVLPEDKELRACLRWMWMKEGWLWDPVTGEKEVLGNEMRRAVDEGRVGYDETGRYFVLDTRVEDGDVHGEGGAV